MQEIGKLLIILGAVLIILGAFFLFFNKIPILGKLPGDILLQRKNFTFYFPLATSILLSLVFFLISLVFFRK